MVAVAARDEIALERVRSSASAVAQPRPRAGEILQHDVVDLEQWQRSARGAGVHEIFRELGLAVDREPRGLLCEVDAITLRADRDLDARVLQAFALEALRDAGFAQDRDGALLDDTGTHSAEHVVATAPFEHDAIDARSLEQLCEQ